MEIDLENIWDSFPKSNKQSKNNDINLDICSSCNKETLKTPSAIICPHCGVISDGIIDFNAEWRFYGSEDSKYSDPTRCGLPTNEPS